MSETFQIATHAIIWTSTLLAVGSCVLRCYHCKCIKRTWKVDDFMALIVGISLLGALGLWKRALFLGCAGPEPNACNYTDPERNILTWSFAVSIYCAFLHFIIRCAVCTLYLQFAAQSTFRLWIGVAFGLNVMLLITDMLITVLQCIPLTAACRFDERIISHCMDHGFVLFVPAVLNAVLNLYVLLLPIPTLCSVQVALRRRTFVACVLSVGGAAVLLGFVRIHTLRILNTNTNTSKGVGEMMIVAVLGLSLAAIAHNLPSIRVLWRHISKHPSKHKDTSVSSSSIRSRNRRQTNTTYRLKQPTIPMTSLAEWEGLSTPDLERGLGF